MEKRKTAERKVLNVVGKGLHGLLGVLGWLIQEGSTTIRLFGISPMLFELVLAIIFTVVVVFPHEQTQQLITFAGTALAIPFVLGLAYSIVNAIWIALRLGWDMSWYWTLAKASVLPTGLAWALFSNRTFQEFVGWGDPERTLRFCIAFVWAVVVFNTLFAQRKTGASWRNSTLFLTLLVVAYLLAAWFLVGQHVKLDVAPIGAQTTPVEEQMAEEVVPILRQEPRSTRPEPMGAFYSTNYPEDVSAAVIAEVIREYSTYMWNSPVTFEEWLMIVEENRLENVNPLWPAAIAAHESHLGAHQSAYAKGNLWGIDKSDVDAGLSDLGTLQNGAREVSQILAWYYFDEGRLTFQALEKKYASQITPPNGAWAARVRYFYEDLAAELAQQTDPDAPAGIPVAEEDGSRFSWNPYYPVLEVRSRVHRGVDIAAGNLGKVWLHSTLDGKVIFAGFIENLCNFEITFTTLPDAGDCPVVALDVTGWTVIIENQNWQIILGHGAREPLVAAGETVERGQKLMLMGATGRAFGRHVHYGIRYRLPSGEWRFVKP